MMLAHRLAEEVGGVAADFRHRVGAFEAIALGPFDQQFDGGFPYVVAGDAVVEQADEGADRAGGVIVLRLRTQKRRAPLANAQIKAVAKGRPAAYAPGTDTRLPPSPGVAPGRLLPHATRRAGPQPRGPRGIG